MSPCFSRVRSSVVQTASASATFFPPVMATSVPSGRCAFVSRSFRARRKSRASMAAEVSLPVRLVCEPRRGRQICPGLDAVRLGGEVPHLLERVAPLAEVVGAVGQGLELVRLHLGAVLGAFEVAHLPDDPVDGAVDAFRWACSMFAKPHSRLSRSSASWVPSGATLSMRVCTACSMPAMASSSSQTKRLSISSGPGVAPNNAAWSQMAAVGEA